MSPSKSPPSQTKPPINRPLLGIGLAVLAMFSFSSQDALTKILISDLPISTVLVVRYTAFTLFAFALASLTGPPDQRGILRSFRSNVTVLHIMRGLLLVAEIFVFSYGVRHLDLGLQHALFAVFPLIITALAMPVLGERVGIWRWSSVALGFVGALIIIRPGLSSFSLFILFPLAAAMMYALYNIFTRIAGRSGDSFQTSMVYLGLFGLLGILPLGVLQWEMPEGGQLWQLGLLCCTAILGHGALILALMFTQASAIQPLNYLLLVFAFFNGFVYFGEVPDIFTVFGGAVIVFSGLFIIIRERIRAREDAGHSAA
ncbi:MAG: DMT family transporter [Alphaproteobacteria bacterium]